jgi:catechol 2,3-dioxygenase-like lactoylglutathione lyase family enzyme
VITDLGHPAFAAHTVERTLDSYALLGVRASFRLHHEDGSLMLVYPHVAGDRFIEVFPGVSLPDPNRRAGFMHLCLLTDDIDAIVGHLREYGAPIDQEPIVGLDRNWQAWTRDSDGNEIELMQLSEQSPQWRTARSAGQDGD